MKKESKKKMKIEDLAVEIKNLAVAISRGFDNVDEKFKEIHKKMDKGFKDVRAEIEDLAIMTGKEFKSVDAMFESVDARFDKVDSRLDNVESKLGQVEHRLVMVEDNTLDLKLRMDVLTNNNNKGADELRSRVVALEKKVGMK